MPLLYGKFTVSNHFLQSADVLLSTVNMGLEPGSSARVAERRRMILKSGATVYSTAPHTRTEWNVEGGLYLRNGYRAWDHGVHSNPVYFLVHPDSLE